MSTLGVSSTTSNAYTPSSSSGTGTSSGNKSSTVNSNSSATLNFGGLVSGIDTSQIIAALESFTNQQISTLQAKGNSYVQMQTVFSSLEANLYGLQTSVNQLSQSAGGPFDNRTATPSDDTVLTATAGTAAVPGTYTVTVNSLAQANQVASQGFSDPNAALKQGTLTVQVGSSDPITVTLDGQNNTLQGLANAINSAGGDVKASIINDGSSTPYRLMLTATNTGAANSIAVTNNLTAGSGADINPTQTTVQAAADAEIKLGTGAGALTVTNGTNQINSLIPGVSLNLLEATPSQPITLTVANDTSGATKAVQNFVTAYNSVVDFISQNSAFDAATQQAGLLLGNQTSSALQNALSSTLSSVVPGLKANANSLAAIGLSFTKSGDLELNTATLTDALNGRNGVSVADVKSLFALSGKSDNPGIAFVYGTSNTQASGGTPYQVNVTSAATRGAATAGTALAGSVTIDGTNNEFTLTVNGTTSDTITLAAGTYTPAQFAAMVQHQINGSSSLGGNLVSVGLTGGNKLQITSQTYGSVSKVAIGTGSAVGAGGPLGFSGSESGTGTDVVGNFVVNGKVEAATGSGQMLTGKAGNANTEGLAVRVTLAGAGTANLTVSQGVASGLGKVLNQYLDPVNGQFATIHDQYQSQIDDVNKQITSASDRLQTQTTNLQEQFAAMETSISKLKTIQNQLTALANTTFSYS